MSGRHYGPLTVGQMLAGSAVAAPLPAVPDAELVRCLTDAGQPVHAAREVYTNPGLRFAALRFWADVQDADKGDSAAKQRVDYCRSEWAQMRRDGTITDHQPRRTILP